MIQRDLLKDLLFPALIEPQGTGVYDEIVSRSRT